VSASEAVTEYPPVTPGMAPPKLTHSTPKMTAIDTRKVPTVAARARRRKTGESFMAWEASAVR
jgi:hypothetical protein